MPLKWSKKDEEVKKEEPKPTPKPVEEKKVEPKPEPVMLMKSKPDNN